LNFRASAGKFFAEVGFRAVVSAVEASEGYTSTYPRRRYLFCGV
jgi:hypothetical protein